MATVIVTSKPTSPGRRFVVRLKTDDIYKGRPYKSLTTGRAKTGGRASSGRISVRHKGGGHKQNYRTVDYKRYDKADVPARVERLEYDPHRTSLIALLCYRDGARRYIVAPEGVRVGDELLTGTRVPVRAGNCMPLASMPLGSVVHCIELKHLKGAQLCRAAGTSAQLLAREGQYATLRLRSGEMRKVRTECYAVLGSVSLRQHAVTKKGKAGASRWRGIRPTVRGVAMNPVDHPHGGGEGKTSGGRHPVSPTGQPTKGYRTRLNKRTDRLIVRRRGMGR